MPEIECPKCHVSKTVDEEVFDSAVGKNAKCRCGHSWIVERPEIDLAAFATGLQIDSEEGVFLPRTSHLPWNDEAKDRIAQVQESRHVIITTTHSVDGYRVEKYLGIESVEYVIGTGIFSEFTAGLADLLGGRATAFEKKLQDAKQVAIETLKFRAYRMGANAVIGVDMDYTEFTGNQIAVVINGTMVLLTRQLDRDSHH